MNEWMNEWMNERMKEWKNERMKEWMNESDSSLRRGQHLWKRLSIMMNKFVYKTASVAYIGQVHWCKLDCFWLKLRETDRQTLIVACMQLKTRTSVSHRWKTDKNEEFPLKYNIDINCERLQQHRTSTEWKERLQEQRQTQRRRHISRGTSERLAH